MSLNGKFLDKDHLQYFWQQIKLKFATAAQGMKADSAVQTIKINNTAQTKTDGVVDLPAYPTKSSLGLGNVDNTSDLNKPISTAVATDQTRQDTVIGIVENKGAKNLLEITRASQTIDGVTFTVNDDDTVTIDTAGVASQNRVQFLLRSVTTYPGMQGCVLSGAVQNNQDVQLRFQLGANPWTVYASDSGSGATISSYSDASLIQVYINVPAGSTVSNLVFKPMICTKAEWDISHEYVPYGKTNAELTVENDSQQSEINYSVNTGVKNLLNPADYIASSRSGVTITYNGDGTYSLSGTPTQSSDYLYTPDNVYTNLYGLQIGQTYMISTGVENTKVLIRIIPSYNGTSYNWNNPIVNNASVEATFTIPSNIVGLLIDFRSTTSAGSLNGIVLKPMIRLASITDSTFQPYALPNPTLTPAAIKAVDEGAKNLLPITIQTQTVKTVVFTVNSDGTITANGTVTGGDAYLNLETSIGDKYTGNILSGGASNLKICISKGGSGQAAVYSESSEGVEIPDNATNTIFLLATNGTQLNNVTVKPMICTAQDWAVSQKYVPYALTNPVITPALIEQVDNGAKNLLRFDETSADNNNVRFTVNADGSITATQIAARTATAVFRMRYTDNLLSQDVRGKILSGCPSGGSDSTYKINIERRTSPYTNYGRDTGNGLLISDTIADDIPLYLYIQVYTTATLPLTFKPMICTAADWGISQNFVPYRPSWQDMTDKIAQIGLKLVKSQTVRSSTEVTYTMNMNDFLESSPIVAQSIGTYVISVMPWNTTPDFSLYTVSYTGGSFAYTSIVKIVGTDRTVTVSNGVISISGLPSTGAKVSIHAML